jgi:hypothetical protein
VEGTASRSMRSSIDEQQNNREQLGNSHIDADKQQLPR